MRLASTWFARRFARRFVGFGLAAGLSLVLIAGCSDSDPNNGKKDGGTTTGDGSVVAKEITIGVTEQLTALDPAAANQTGTFELLMNVNQTLYLWDAAKLDYVPGLAAGEPVVATEATPNPDDGAATEQTWTITLREGLTFADDTPFNADAVKYSVERVIGLKVGASYLVSSYVSRVEKLGEYKVKFALAKPIGFFKALLATQPYAPVNRSQYPAARALNTPFTLEAQTPNATVDGEGKEKKAWNEQFRDQNLFVADKLLGLGPYRIEAIGYDETKNPDKGEYGRYTSVTLVANPTYSGGPNGVPARTQRIVLKYFKDSVALEQALKDGSVQVAWNTIPASAVKVLGADAANYKVFDSDGLITETLYFNGRVPPFGTLPTASDEDKAKALKTRKAVALAIDRQAIVDSIFGLAGKPLYSMVPQGLWSYVEAFKTEFTPPPPSLSEAKKLLGEAGYTESNKLSFEMWYSSDYPENSPMSDKIKADLESTGLVTVTKKDAGGFGGYVGVITRSEDVAKEDHTYQAFWLGWSPDYGDPDNFVFQQLDSTVDLVGSSLYSTNPAKANDLDALLLAAKTDANYQTRVEKYKQIQQLVAQTVPAVPVVQRSKQAVARKGFTLTPAGPDTLLNYATVAVAATK
ncbi:MAG: hypothetical protein IPG96_04165 [Proteobacteria bacterium]|nr:hypothetical protein [Pseudomonadota bacterium]